MTFSLKMVRYWLPAFAWMMVIFLFSSRQRAHVSDIFSVNFLFFKTLHIIEYAALYFLVFRAIYLTNHKRTSQNILSTAFLISIIYAISDEIHQTFIPTREGKIRDVFIDMIGMTLMYSFIRSQFAKVKRYLK